jgi:hypothetical protein
MPSFPQALVMKRLDVRLLIAQMDEPNVEPNQPAGYPPGVYRKGKNEPEKSFRINETLEKRT